MPGNEPAITGFLGIKMTRPDHDVRADQILDHVENSRVAHQLVDPREQQVTFVAKLAVHRSAGIGLVSLQGGKIVGGDIGAERRLGKQQAVRTVSVDLITGQT